MGKFTYTHTHTSIPRMGVTLSNRLSACLIIRVISKGVTILLLLYRLFKEICAESASNDVEFYSDGSWHPITANDSKSCVHLCQFIKMIKA